MTDITMVQVSRRSPAPVQRRIAMRNKGYELRMSKSSDSITAAKLLAEARMNQAGSGLRINKDMSKSIEKQIDVYTKTREEIRRILQVRRSFRAATYRVMKYNFR